MHPLHSNREFALEARRKGKQSNVPRLLDRQRKPALMPGANARQTARHNLPALRHKALQQPHIAVTDRIDLLRAELANLLAPEELTSSRTAAGTARGTWPRSRSARGTRPTGRARTAAARIRRRAMRRCRGRRRCCLLGNVAGFVSHCGIPFHRYARSTLQTR